MEIQSIGSLKLGKIMKKILFVILALVVLYFLGPHPDAPTLPGPSWNDIPQDPMAVSAYLKAKEATNGIHTIITIIKEGKKQNHSYNI